MRDKTKRGKNAGIGSRGLAGILMFCAWLALGLLCTGARHGIAQVNPPADDHSWTCGNPTAQIVFRLDTKGLFRITNFGPVGGKEWAIDGQSPIYIQTESFTLDAQTRWTLVDDHTEAASHNGRRQVIDLRDVSGKSEVKLNVESYPNEPFVRFSYVYSNLDNKGHTVQEARFFNLRLNPERRPIRALYLNQSRRGTPLMFDIFDKDLGQEPNRMVTVNAGAYADNITWLALRDPSDNGLVFGWEFDGRSWLNAQLSQAGDELDVWGSPSDLHTSVAAGGKMAVPGGFVGLYQGDWDEAGYRTQRYTEDVLAVSLPDNNYPYLMYDTWGYGTNLDEKTLRQVADIAAYMGVELFIVDLGWAQHIGDWQADPAKFPSGLPAFANYVRSKGMKFGLHFVPVEAEPQAAVLQEHPDWTSTENNGYFNAESICISNSATQAWLRSAAQAMADQYQPDWLVQDGENLVKTCTKTSHSHGKLNSNWANSQNGIDSFITFMRGKYSKINWENNADGGTMSTYRAVKYYAGFASCDACYYTQRRQAIYGMTYAFPPRFITRYMLEQPPTRFFCRSSMFGGPWILMQRPTEWSQADIELVRQEAQVYKSLRGLIRSGKVYHLLNRPDGINIDAIESFDAASNRGVIFVYRPQSQDFSKLIYPRGLNPAKNYRVTFQESGDAIVDTGANLMARGINVKLPDINFAEIVYINGF